MINICIMEDSKAEEGEVFIKPIDDEVDVRLGTNSINKNENKNRSETSGNKRFPSFWTRRKV